MSKVPYLSFDTDNFPVEQRLSQYRCVAPQYVVTLPEGQEEAGFHAHAEAFMLGESVMASTHVSPTRFSRSEELARADGNSLISVFVLLSGQWSGNLDENVVAAGPGQVVLFDQARSFDLTATETTSISFFVKRSIFDGCLPVERLHGLIIDGVAGRVLAEHLMLLLRRLPLMDQASVPDALSAAFGTIRTCVSMMSPPPPEDEPSVRSRLMMQRFSQYIDRNLDNPNLSLETICRDLGVSRSALYRIFMPLTGVSSYIRARRLEAIHVLLEDDPTSETNAKIAADYGFISPAHFSHRFRQRYGYSPRQARNHDSLLRGVPAVSEFETAKEFGRWIDGLD